MKEIILLFVITCLLNIDKAKRYSNEISTINQSSKSIQNPNNKLPENVCINFLKWYTINQNKLRFKMIDTMGDSTKPYRINFYRVNFFLKRIKKSGYVSDIYIKNIENVFQKTNKYLIENPQYDGPVDGLETDVVFQIMEENEIKKHLLSFRLTQKKINQHLATIMLIRKYPASYGIVKRPLYLKFTLTDITGHWLIDSFEPSYQAY